MKRLLLPLAVLVILFGGVVVWWVATTEVSRPNNTSLVADNLPADENDQPAAPPEEGEAPRSQGQIWNEILGLYEAPSLTGEARDARVKVLLQELEANAPERDLNPYEILFSGRVVDHAGRPLEGVILTVQTIEALNDIEPGSIMPMLAAQTGPDGRFRTLEPVLYESGTRVEVFISAYRHDLPTLEPIRMTMAPGQRYEEFTVTFDLSTGYSGRIVDAEGNPVANARVAVLDKSEHQWPLVQADTDEAGQFSVGGITAGEHVLRVTAPGYLRQEVRAPWVSSNEIQPLEHELVLVQTAVVKLKIMGPEWPVKGSVRLFFHDASGGVLRVYAMADSRGNVTFGPVPVETVAVSVLVHPYDESERVAMSIKPGDHLNLGAIHVGR